MVIRGIGNGNMVLVVFVLDDKVLSEIGGLNGFGFVLWWCILSNEYKYKREESVLSYIVLGDNKMDLLLREVEVVYNYV